MYIEEEFPGTGNLKTVDGLRIASSIEILEKYFFNLLNLI